MRNLKSKKPKVGQILCTPFKKYMIYSVVIRNKHFDNINICVMRNSLRNLKALLITQKRNPFRISRKGDIVDKLGDGVLSQALIANFDLIPIKVTLCYGTAIMPPQHERVQIISSLHDSLEGGHKEMDRTYRKIRERYYWKGMRNDITNFVRIYDICNECKINRVQKHP